MDGQMLFEMLGGEQHRGTCVSPSLCAICSLGLTRIEPPDGVTMIVDEGGAGILDCHRLS